MNKQKIDFHKMLWYFTIFSIIGLIIETLFCYITTSVIESRKGLILGPFCPVYGVGAVLLIVLLSDYKDNCVKLFIIGAIVGNIIEYLLSYTLEAFYGTRFWDYSFIDLNLNGRVCIKYSLFWGMLAVILVKYIKPRVDIFIEKINNKVDKFVTIFFIIDSILTVFAIMSYQNRVEDIFNYKENKKLDIILQKIFPDEVMMKTFPNLRYVDNNGKEYYIKELIENLEYEK